MSFSLDEWDKAKEAEQARAEHLCKERNADAYPIASFLAKYLNELMAIDWKDEKSVPAQATDSILNGIYFLWSNGFDIPENDSEFWTKFITVSGAIISAMGKHSIDMPIRRFQGKFYAQRHISPW